ncbi:MAG TPA: helix-turn-helix domain-containing protein [Gammaproteobacteria bacterium]|nr:helix-turn-helix domain-containing protein [Gammaproteobacteria bacterium]
MSIQKKCPAPLGNPKKSKHPYSNSAASQRARILEHFVICPRLSTLEAREKYGILHPGGRVMELRKKGYHIDTHWISAPDSNGVLHRIGQYVFHGEAIINV